MRAFRTRLQVNPGLARSAFIQNSLPRGFALFLGTFCVLNLFNQAWGSPFDGNFWWIDLHFVPVTIAQPLLLVAAALMIWYGLHPVGSAWRRSLTVGTLGLLALGIVENDIQFYALLSRGAIHAGIPLALWAVRYAKSLLFGVEAADPLAIAITVGVLIAIAAIAGYVPGRRAVRVDPMTALRYE